MLCVWISAAAKGTHKFRFGDNPAVDSTDSLSKGSEGQPHQLKVLHAERNAHDGDAKQYAKEKMGERHPYSTKYNPEYIHEGIQASGTGWRRDNLGSKGDQGRYGQLE